MQISDIPARLPIPFANSGPKNSIPTASQIAITPGAASLTDGFPPLTMTPVAAGGVPPFGQDMNGILFATSAWSRWVAAGAPVSYDATFQTAIGGYPRGAMLVSSVPGRFWVSTVDNNVTNPNSGGAGWQPFAPSGAGVLVSLASPLTIGNNSETAVTWPTPIYDDLTFWSSGAPTRLTIPSNVSRIRISCQTTWDNQTSGDRKMRVVKNGADEGNGLPAMRLPSAGSGDVTALNAAGGVVNVTAGDYLQLLVIQDRGANLDLRATNTWMQIEVVR